jgi:hypothetical protein
MHRRLARILTVVALSVGLAAGAAAAPATAATVHVGPPTPIDWWWGGK